MATAPTQGAGRARRSGVPCACHSTVVGSSPSGPSPSPGCSPSRSAPSPPRTSRSLLEQFAKRSREAEAKGLAEPFRGITAAGTVEPNLFPVRSTGVTTEPVRTAAVAFLASLTDDQRRRTTFAVDDAEWRKWMNQHFYRRQGVSFEELSAAQRDRGDRAAARGVERPGPDAHPGHHEAEPHAGRAERQRLRAVRRVEVPRHADGRAVVDRAVGMAARRPSRDHQLLRAGRSGGDDAASSSAPSRSRRAPASTRACPSCRTSRPAASPS